LPYRLFSKEEPVFVLGLKMRSVVTAMLGMACLATGFAGTPMPDDRMVVVRREDAKFVPLDPADPDEVQVAILWGDPATGPSAMLMRMKKAAGVLHFHTSTYDLILLEGQMKHFGEREKEAEVRPLGPGSFWHQPGGQSHGDSCLTDECLMFIKWEGKRDAIESPPKSR
jgi:Domain of unknown function (DUF4437)